MKVSGFTIIRNGIKLDYPFVESIKSGLPICDEFIVIVGDSKDGTRDKILEINSDKIKIIDTFWDENLRKDGKILAQQTNIGLDHIKGDWGLYLQADEILHEKDINSLYKHLEQELNNNRIEGLLFPYIHFWGYEHKLKSRGAYRYEIRAVKNNPQIRSYRDAQGFRKYTSKETYQKNEKGNKLRVKKLSKEHIYAYSKVRPPKAEMEKIKYIARYWHNDKSIDKKYEGKEVFDYQKVDIIEPFDINKHPKMMQKRVQNASWKFVFSKPSFTLKTWVLYHIERLTGWRIGEYRNYKVVK